MKNYLRKQAGVAATFISLVLIAVSAKGQELPSQSNPGGIISGIYIQPGVYLQRVPTGTLADFKALAPQSKLLANNLDDYSQSNYITWNGYRALSVLLAHTLRGKQNNYPGPEVRFGFTYFSGQTLTGYLYKNSRMPTDTLVSAETGRTIYVDSVNNQSYSMEYGAEHFRLDGSVLFRTDPEARWSVFSGLGITGGIAFNSYINIYKSSFNTEEYRLAEGGYSASFSRYSSYGYASQSETFRNKSYFGLGAYVPFGLDFRIGKEREFWKHMHVFYEARPGISFSFTPEIETVSQVAFQQGIGLKIMFN
jgi:hypothetical protein